MNVAVLSCNKSGTIDWLTRLLRDPNNPNKPNVVMSQGIVLMGGDKYFVITEETQIRGLEIDAYMKSPNYWTLEDTVKSRILSR